MIQQAVSSRVREFTLMHPIVGSHVKRLGWIRTIAGGLPMYLCIPMLVTMHLTTILVLYQWLFRPLLGASRLRWRDYVVIDRQRIRALPAFDHFNCMFCGYANGICTMINKELDQFDAVDRTMGSGRQALLLVLLVLTLPLVLFYELNVQIIYNLLVAPPLGMHRVSIKQAGAVLDAKGFASRYPAPSRFLIRSAKNTMLRFALSLEQIESSWCPLRHFEQREGIVYPEHHKKFFGPDEIEAMRQVLLTDGTVSDRKPEY